MHCFVSPQFITVLLVAALILGVKGARNIVVLPCKKNKALADHVIDEIELRKSDEDKAFDACTMMCYLDERCASINFVRFQQHDFVCQLSDTNHVKYPDDVISQLGTKYCALQENPCACSPCQFYQICKPDFYLNSFKCLDIPSCADIKSEGKNFQGFNVQVYCDQETNGGGWTVIQKRLDGSVDFYRGWDDYKRGFGDKNGEYWLGLDAIHILTNSRQNELRVELEDFQGNRAYALYGSFKVGPESEDYILNVANFKGGYAGDSLSYHDWMKFSTFDRDNDDNEHVNCAAKYKGAWWYRSCHKSNVNGFYHHGYHASYADGVNWQTWKGYNYSVKVAQMMIRPASFKPLK